MGIRHGDFMTRPCEELRGGPPDVARSNDSDSHVRTRSGAAKTSEGYGCSRAGRDRGSLFLLRRLHDPDVADLPQEHRLGLARQEEVLRLLAQPVPRLVLVFAGGGAVSATSGLP